LEPIIILVLIININESRNPRLSDQDIVASSATGQYLINGRLSRCSHRYRKLDQNLTCSKSSCLSGDITLQHTNIAIAITITIMDPSSPKSFRQSSSSSYRYPTPKLLDLPYEVLKTIIEHIPLKPALQTRSLCRIWNRICLERLKKAVTRFKLILVPDIRSTHDEESLGYMEYQMDAAIRFERAAAAETSTSNHGLSDCLHFTPTKPFQTMLEARLPMITVSRMVSFRRLKCSIDESVRDPNMGIVVYNGVVEDQDSLLQQNPSQLFDMAEIKTGTFWDVLFFGICIRLIRPHKNSLLM
jgi:hypothetical protein